MTPSEYLRAIEQMRVELIDLAENLEESIDEAPYGCDFDFDDPDNPDGATADDLSMGIESDLIEIIKHVEKMRRCAH